MRRDDQTEALGALLEVASGKGGPHPGPEELVAYQAGELSEEEELRLQDHLVGCPACAALVVDLADFAEAASGAAEEPPAGVRDFETAAAWRSMRARLGEAEDRAAARRPLGRLLYPLAAALLLATVGLTVWVGQLRQTVEELTGPQANVPVLYFDATTRSEGPDVESLTAPAGEGFLLLVLTPPDPDAFATYRVEITGPSGGMVHRRGDLVPSDYGTLRLGLARGSLPPGEYRVRLFGVEDGAERPLEEYPLRIKP